MIRTLLYGRKRKDRWWRYLALREVFLDAQHRKDPDKALVKVFGKLGYGQPAPAFFHCWNHMVQIGSGRTSSLADGMESNLIAEIRALDSDALSVLGWLDFFHLGIGLGLYCLADSFRDKGIQLAVIEAKTGDPGLEKRILGFYGCVETGDYQTAQQLVETLQANGCEASRVEQAQWFLNLFRAREEGQNTGLGPPELSDDTRFGRYIEGKHLALVGPVPTETAHGPEIDGHDIVVKFSYRGGDKGRDPKTQGRRLDVSYYNNTQAQALAESNYADVLDAIDWGICINRKGRSRFPKQLDNLRQVASLQWLLPDTHFNAGPNAVLDLLRFNPTTIKVFNTDLMLSAGRYAGYRPAGAKPIEYTRSFIKTHDPVLQYKTMHRLWEMGYIVGDERFEEVMGMGLDEYLVNLQQVHGANEQALL